MSKNSRRWLTRILQEAQKPEYQTPWQKRRRPAVGVTSDDLRRAFG